MASTNGPAGLNLIGRRAQVREAKQEADRKKAEAEAVEKDASELDAFSKKGKTAADAYGKARDDAKRSIDDIKKQLDESRKAIQDTVDCDAKARVDARLEALTAHLARLKKAIDDLDGMPEPPCGPSVVALTIARDHARLQVTRAEFELTTLLELPQELPKKIAQLTKLATQLTGDLCTRAQDAESNYRLFSMLGWGGVAGSVRRRRGCLPHAMPTPCAPTTRAAATRRGLMGGRTRSSRLPKGDARMPA